jgi:hypothetical protein
VAAFFSFLFLGRGSIFAAAVAHFAFVSVRAPEHIMNEKRTMAQLNHPFLVRLSENTRDTTATRTNSEPLCCGGMAWGRQSKRTANQSLNSCTMLLLLCVWIVSPSRLFRFATFQDADRLYFLLEVGCGSGGGGSSD